MGGLWGAFREFLEGFRRFQGEVWGGFGGFQEGLRGVLRGFWGEVLGESFEMLKAFVGEWV